MNIMEVVELIVTRLVDKFVDPNITIFDAPFLFMVLGGLAGFNSIQEPLEASDGKKFCVALMVAGALGLLIPFLLSS